MSSGMLCVLFLVFTDYSIAREPFIIQKVSIGKSTKNRTDERRTKRDLSSPAKNVTFLLNQILENYEKSFRPGFDKQIPTPVFIDISVRTLGPVSEMTDTYEFNCYFRQTWTDERLRFSAGGRSSKQLSLAMSMLDKIWKPDIYFWNGAKSYVHTLTVPNRLVRLSEDGTVLYSSRLTVKARCRMDLHRYPLDRQACRLVVGSYAYNVNEITLQWKNNTGVQVEYKALVELPQFTVNRVQVINQSLLARHSNYSVLEVRFYLNRHFGYFLMNFYVPSTLIVLLCWVAFWINREATQERVGLVITNVLTLTFMSLDSKKDSPKTDFPTALDVYIWICFGFLFLCMVEFTIVHYFTKYNTGDQELIELERRKIRNILKSIPKQAVMSSRHYSRPHHIPDRTASSHRSIRSRRDGGRYSMKAKRVVNQRPRPLSTQTSVDHPSDNSTEPDRNHFRTESLGWRLYYYMLDHDLRHDPFSFEGNSISLVDRFSRVTLPALFGFVVLLYYIFYVQSPYDFDFNTENSLFISHDVIS